MAQQVKASGPTLEEEPALKKAYPLTHTHLPGHSSDYHTHHSSNYKKYHIWNVLKKECNGVRGHWPTGGSMGEHRHNFLINH